MSTKKKKYNCRFPPARIKKIMQADEEVGKVAAVVPLIISRALELFVESLLTESSKITKSRNARTLTPSHLKACITSNSQFSFLRDFVATIPDIQSVGEDEHSDGNSSTGNNNYAHHPIQGSTSSSTSYQHAVTSTSLTTSSSTSTTSPSAANAASISFSGSNLTRQISSTNRPSRSTNFISRVSGRGRGRPRKVNVTSARSQEEEDEADYEEENDITEAPRNVNKSNHNRSNRRDDDDETETSDDDEEGSSCDDSSSNASRAHPNPPLHSQINSFTIALNQQVEDDDYDN